MELNLQKKKKSSGKKFQEMEFSCPIKLETFLNFLAPKKLNKILLYSLFTKLP